MEGQCAELTRCYVRGRSSLRCSEIPSRISAVLCPLVGPEQRGTATLVRAQSGKIAFRPPVILQSLCKWSLPLPAAIGERDMPLIYSALARLSPVNLKHELIIAANRIGLARQDLQVEAPRQDAPWPLSSATLHVLTGVARGLYCMQVGFHEFDRRRESVALASRCVTWVQEGSEYGHGG
ncbi:hypothetical protein FKP32DRAFT_163444 [Trametes sanguinea]|nr:hypothetical protein FKP32DRAFT_163444 [Trametes sanguinea]